MDGEIEPSGAGALPGDQRLDTRPVQPSADVRAELVALLETDETRLGEVYRGLQRGLDAASIAAELEISSSNFVWNYERAAKALLDGNLPTAPTVALQVARKFRSILKSAQLSPAARACLETNLGELERRANDETARVAEVRHAQEQTQAAEARNDTGIYVYALPHYLRYPFEPDSGRTLMKVGRSDRDIIQRFRSQTRTTALPEEPICCAYTGPIERAPRSQRLISTACSTRQTTTGA